MRHHSLVFILLSCVALLFGVGTEPVYSIEVTTRFLAEGVTAKVGGYRPVSAEMSDEAGEEIEVAPDELSNASYGTLEFGDQSFLFILDEPMDADATLYVDTNADGDLTNDPETEWEPRESGEHTMYFGAAKVEIHGENATVRMYRFDPTDERRERLAKTLLYYGDFGSEFEFKLDGQSFSTFCAGAVSGRSRLPVNRDDNPRVSRNYEYVVVGKPFNFTGTTYEFSVVEGKLMLEESDSELPQLPLPPDLRLGKKTLSFTATTMNGDRVSFPEDYAGKIVMLDMWATWCGPCIAEIPHMKEAYETHHEHGFEILGVSFDREGKEDKVKEFLEDRELPWAQIYEGKGWDTSIGEQYDVSGIPFVLLIDGDSGEIIGTSRQLRGPGLKDYIEQQLDSKNGVEDGEDEDDENEDQVEEDGDDGEAN